MPNINDSGAELMRKIRAEDKRAFQREREANEQRALMNSLNKIQSELSDLKYSRERQEQNSLEEQQNFEYQIWFHSLTTEQQQAHLKRESEKTWEKWGSLAFAIACIWSFFNWPVALSIIKFIWYWSMIWCGIVIGVMILFWICVGLYKICK